MILNLKSHLSFNFYGFFIVLGILVGVLVVQKIKEHLPADATALQAGRKKIEGFVWLKSLDIYQTLTWILLPAIVSARLYHVWDYWQYYQENLVEILFVWQGGLGIFGGILGGLVGLAIFLKFKVQSSKFKNTIKNLKFTAIFLSYLDLGVVGLAIGQAIGRWGNFFNQELYGLPTNLPWGIYIHPENRLPGFENFSYFHPLFFYESLGCLLIFLILIKKIKISNPQLKSQNFLNPGCTFFTYLFLYSLLRFGLEFLRPQGWQVQICPLKYIRVTHIITSLVMLVSLLALVRIFVTMKKEQK